MPAPIAEEMQPDLHVEQLEAVGKAFDALLLTLYRLTNRHNDLKGHAEEMFQQVNTPFLLVYLSRTHHPSPLPLFPVNNLKSQMMRKFD